MSPARIIPLVLLSLILTAFGPVMNEVISAIRSGDAVRISKHLDEVVRITMEEKSNAYSRGQGEMILRNFFADRGVRQFEIQQKGQAADVEYFVGELVLSDEKRYRMSVYMKDRSGRRYIQEIRLDP